MIPRLGCPSPEELRRLLLGQIPDPEGETLAQHLEGCDECSARVDSIEADDTLIEAARAGAVTLSSQIELEVGNELHAPSSEMWRLNTPASAARTGVFDSSSASPNGSVEVKVEDYAFLAPAQEPDELGRLAHYRILKLLGDGGMGIVFQAEDINLKRKVALKVMKPTVAENSQYRQRFLREARAAAALEHDHVVTIYQVGEDGGVAFFAMQWLKGRSLEEHLQGTGVQRVAQVLHLGQQMACGLAVAHAAGLIHRDVKPANIWLEAGAVGRIKILDFGLVHDVDADAALTQSGMIMGTPSYMAPEQAGGEKIDHRADLFSLGVIFYRMLTGRLPFQGKNTMAILRSLMLDEPPALPIGDVCRALSDLVMQLLAKDPQARPASAQAVVERLRDIERQLPNQVVTELTITPSEPQTFQVGAESTIAPPEPVILPRPVRGRRLVGVAVALLLLLPLSYFFGGSAVRFATDKGELVVRIDDPSVEVAVMQNGVVVQDKTTRRTFVLTAGDGEVEVFEKDSGLKLTTRKFSLARGGKEIVAVELAQQLAPKFEPQHPEREQPIIGSDRAAAEWVLSLGGRITFSQGGQEKEVMAVKDLPTGNLQVTEVNLEGVKGVDDDGLKKLQGLPQLKILSLIDTRITDVGLEHLQKLTQLRYLRLSVTQISDAGLKHLQGLSQLWFLDVAATKVSDTGLSHLQKLTRLGSIDLTGSRITDNGLKHLQGLKSLHEIALINTAIGDAGLEHLQKLTTLRSIYLSGTLVSDAGLVHLQNLNELTLLHLMDTTIGDKGLAHLQKLTELVVLRLNNTQVSDAGLVSLKPLTRLRELDLTGTKVTALGIAALRKALPQCRNLSPASK